MAYVPHQGQALPKFRHRPHGEVDDPHQGLIPLLHTCDPHP